MADEAEEELLAPSIVTLDIDCHEADNSMLGQLTNDASYVGRRLSTDTRVPGHIHRPEFRQFWEDVLQPDEYVMGVIRDGYRLPFYEIPPPGFHPNNKSAREDHTFVLAELRRLESLGCIKRVSKQPYLVLPLSSVFSKKKRLVVDGSRHLNPYLLKRRVRLSDLRDVPDLVKEGMIFTCHDLDSGYWHVQIAEEHQQFLGVSVEDEEGNQLFWTWNVMFLGISDAAYLFTQVLKPVGSYLRKSGVPNIIYIDDIFLAGLGLECSLKNQALALDVLEKSGFVVSKSKSTGPSSRLKFLGLDICSSTMSFYIPEEKVQRFLGFIEELLSQRRVKVRDLARTLGYLQSFYRALGDVTRFKTRSCYHWISKKLEFGGYNRFYILDEASKDELLFWSLNIRELNGIKFSPSKSQVSTMIITDASADGMFGYQFGDLNSVVLRKLFSQEERRASSTLRELLCLKYIYTSEVSSRYQGENVLHITDNRAAVSIMSTGSRKPHLQKIAVEIFQACKAKNIHLTLEWRPRDDELVRIADQGSKSFDPSAVSLDFDSFIKILEFISPQEISVDCMANEWNRKASIFFSKNSELGSSGINFFSQPLNNRRYFYIFPPPSLVTASIIHFNRFKARGVLVIPMWFSSVFWNNILEDGSHFSNWVQKWMIFKPSGFISDPAINSTTFKNPVTFKMLVVEFDFSVISERDNIFISSPQRHLCIHNGCSNCS